MDNYELPIDKKYFMAGSNSLDIRFSGSISTLLNRLKSYNHNSNSKLNQNYQTSQFILNVPRVLRGLLEAKIEYSNSEDLSDCIETCTNLLVDMYKNPSSTPTLVNNLESYLENNLPNNLFENILNYNFEQPSAPTTISFSNPKYTKKNSKLLSQMLNNQDILLLPLAFGGLLAGIDTFLQYTINECKNNTNSKIYPVKYSIHKGYDNKPNLSELECNKLKNFSKGRKVVIFDEDSNSGRTLDLAKKYFSETLELDDILVYGNYPYNDRHNLAKLIKTY